MVLRIGISWFLRLVSHIVPTDTTLLARERQPRRPLDMKTPQWDDKGFGVRITDLTVSLGHKFVEIGAIHSTLLMKRGHETAAIASG